MEVRVDERVKARLINWLRKIANEPERQADVQLALHRLMKDRGELVAEVLHPLDKAPEDTIAEVLDLAEANIIVRRTSFVLRALRADGSASRVNFPLEPVRARAVPKASPPPQPPHVDLEGLLSQQMAHTQVLVDKLVEMACILSSRSVEAISTDAPSPAAPRVRTGWGFLDEKDDERAVEQDVTFLAGGLLICLGSEGCRRIHSALKNDEASRVAFERLYSRIAETRHMRGLPHPLDLDLLKKAPVKPSLRKARSKDRP